MLSYDSLNILSNLFSIHIFLLLVMSQALIIFILQLSCCQVHNQKYLKICRKAKNSKINEIIVISTFRIFLTGFLEILICASIGIGIFSLPGELTKIDKVTCVVNIFYIVCLIVFSVTLFWFIFVKAKLLIKFKETRDRLEHLKVLRIIFEKYGKEAEIQQ